MTAGKADAGPWTPSKAALRILLVEDSDDDAELLRLALRKTPFQLERAGRLAEAFELLSRAHFDVVLLDLSLPDSQGFDTFVALQGGSAHEALVVLTGLDDEELGLRAVRCGAQDYLVKGKTEPPLLIRAIRYAWERKQAEEVTIRLASELRRKNAELQEDLMLAREVQQAFLPQHHPTFTTAAPGGRAGSLAFCHRYLPAGPVGGDLFDVFSLPDGQVGVFICDVMGHGVRAALIAAMLRALIGSRAPSIVHPGRLLDQLNLELRAILRDTDPPLFVSAFYLVADPASGEMRFSSAGHPTPLRIEAGARRVEPLWPPDLRGGTALGLSDGAYYPATQAHLDPGDRLLLFTDGLYEVEGRSAETFGEEQLREAALSRAELPPDMFLDDLILELRRFSKDGQFADDVCALTMDFRRPEATISRDPARYASPLSEARLREGHP